jgi:hypothetical protein
MFLTALAMEFKQVLFQICMTGALYNIKQIEL